MKISLIDFSKPPVSGNLNVRWIHGSPRHKNASDPPIQSHNYDEHTVILRQSKDVSFEAPYMYLLFGNERALLLDTGATTDQDRFPLRKTVDLLMDDWLAKNPRENYGLIIAHTHGHSDHTSGDVQFMNRPNTKIIPKDLESVKKFFRLDNWPKGSAELDL